MESLIENVKLIVMIASAILSAVCVILYIISKCTQKQAVKEKTENAIKTTQSILDVLYMVQSAVISAESNKNFTNTEKFAFAEMKVKDSLLKQNKKIDDELLTSLIENEVNLSKKVNADEMHKAKSSDLQEIKIIKEE